MTMTKWSQRMNQENLKTHSYTQTTMETPNQAKHCQRNKNTVKRVPRKKKHQEYQTKNNPENAATAKFQRNPLKSRLKMQRRQLKAKRETPTKELAQYLSDTRRVQMFRRTNSLRAMSTYPQTDKAGFCACSYSFSPKTNQ